ncbi:PH domain-containing protein [Propioniciclava sp.]|uniref:PH domain-containing protein n=1 Tax=Propioniciclava sp. TaxID=2038686 RepID=UPI00344C8FA4
MSALSRFFAPEVARRMLVDEGEFIVDEVYRHWVTRVLPSLAVFGGMACFLLMPLLGSGWWVGLFCGLALGAWGFYRIHLEFMDRFVITNMRVFRVRGVVDQHMATMPIARILDISVRQTFLGQLLGYGHFVFESAAQDQGLKQIDFVPHIERRDLTIQRVIQRAGLRARMEREPDPDALDGA